MLPKNKAIEIVFKTEKKENFYVLQKKGGELSLV